MNAYQTEQMQALELAMSAMQQMPPHELRTLKGEIEPYLDFRHRVDRFLEAHFSMYCTKTCYESRLSACCGKDGIITFWADVVINACMATSRQLKALEMAIRQPLHEIKCIFLSPSGCCWAVRPLICSMFICGQAQQAVWKTRPTSKKRWQGLIEEAKTYRWPDRTVLFDTLEKRFMAFGYRSPLMYLNTSPGLLRIKKKAGIL
jgi:hypothetical protein